MVLWVGMVLADKEGIQRIPGVIFVNLYHIPSFVAFSITITLCSSCGDNPEKMVPGISVRSQFLASNHGKYTSVSGDFLSVASDGSVVQGKVVSHDLMLSEVNQNEIKVQPDQGPSRTITVTSEQVKRAKSMEKRPLNDRNPQRVSFTCFYGQRGLLKDVMIVPIRKKGLRYVWELERFMAEQVKYVATFALDGQNFTEVKKESVDGNLAEVLSSQDLLSLMNEVCSSNAPNYFDIKGSLGLISYDESKLEIYPGNTYSNQHLDSIHRIDQRFLFKDGIGEVDVGDRFWVLADGLFLKADHTYSRQANKYVGWEIKSPREELNFSSKDHRLVWKKEPDPSSGECGFEIGLDITGCHIRPSSKRSPGFFDASFRVLSANVNSVPGANNGNHCETEGILENLKKNENGNDKIRLFLKVNEDTGNGISIELREGSRNILSIDQALPWSDKENRLKPRFGGGD
ncbi:MAG: hypothetical protein IPJ71_17920 [Bdellovibrionales bacterium]|nr:hypothetical protein [Bdellovibrionales bacterium]